MFPLSDIYFHTWESEISRCGIESLLLLASYCLCGWKTGWVCSRATAGTRTALWRGGCSRSRSPGQRSGRSEREESAGTQEHPPSCRSEPSARTPWRTKRHTESLKYSCHPMRAELVVTLMVEAETNQCLRTENVGLPYSFTLKDTEPKLNYTDLISQFDGREAKDPLTQLIRCKSIWFVWVTIFLLTPTINDFLATWGELELKLELLI